MSKFVQVTINGSYGYPYELHKPNRQWTVGSDYQVTKYQGQSEVSIGALGHVDHGKTTMVSYLTGEWTDRHSDEVRRGISIRLGYAATTLLNCTKCPETEGYTTSHHAKDGKCPKCGGKLETLR